VGRTKKEKKRKKLQAVRNNSAVPKNTVAAPKSIAASPAQSDLPDLSHLSGDWQEFYRLVIDQVR